MPLNNDGFESFKEWLKFHGGFVHSALTRDNRNDLLGIFAMEPIKKSEILAVVPPSLVVGPDLFSNFTCTSSQFLKHERDQTVFALLLEIEKEKSSDFYPWISQLPTLKTFEASHPYFATNEDLELLHQLNPRIVRTLENFKQRIAEFQRQTHERFELAQVVWASLIYLTRAFEGLGLIPLFDMFNHDADLQQGIICSQIIKARRSVQPGEQVYISYGSNFDSLQLWLQFGFFDRSAAPIVNCKNVKIEQVSVVFGQDSYFDRNGPSSGLLEVCERIKSSGQKTEEIIFLLARALSREVGECKFSESSLVQQARELMWARKKVLDPAMIIARP